MFIKLSSAFILSAAVAVAAAGASATDLNLHENGRSLQGVPASIACIVGGSPFTDCCPSADPADGVCTLLWCVDLDEVKIRDNCGCGQIETACGQVTLFSGVVPGLTEMCASVGTCCDGGAADNSNFDTCLGAAIGAGDFTVPDFNAIIPGGIPNLDVIPSPDLGGGVDNATDAAAVISDLISDLGGGVDNATDAAAVISDLISDLGGGVDNATDAAAVITDLISDLGGGVDNATDAAAVITDLISDLGGGDDNETDLAVITDIEPEASTTTTAATTAAGVTTTTATAVPGDSTSTDGSKEPDDTNDASRSNYAVKMMYLIGSSLAIVFV